MSEVLMQNAFKNYEPIVKQALGNNYVLKGCFFPELGEFYRGKIADNHMKGNKLYSFRTDRISAFDYVLNGQQIPFKGAAQIGMTYHALKKTKVPHAMIEMPDPNVLVYKKCKPFPIEAIVRGYLTGSFYKNYYSKGLPNPWKIEVKSGLKEYDKFSEPIFTPTTKPASGHDLDIPENEIIEKGYATKEQLKQVKENSFQLFKEGTETAAAQDLILVDTKFEYGIDENGNIVVIDEILTLDSSRFWYKKDYDENVAKGKSPYSWSKQIDRDIFSSKGDVESFGCLPRLTLDEIIKTSVIYMQMHKGITGQDLIYNPAKNQSIEERILENMVSKGYAKGGCAILMAASKIDQPHYSKIADELTNLNVPCFISEPLSAHKETQKILNNVELYNTSVEPIVYINVAGGSNGLGPIISGKIAKDKKSFTNIACPVFADKSTMQMDAWSSLNMPSDIAMPVILRPRNAALEAKNQLKL
ncbi:MAG: phosphoribosylaminoimidazolesuccinocarboxamide synthase [Candidatus Nanoarchaeia archaeon]|jgi:phosphoribosylaminoimidazole-succinocarboxamide synthase